MEESGVGRLVGVLVAPAKTFESIAGRPTWVVALVALLLVAATINFVAVDKIDTEAEVRRAFEGRSSGATEEQVDQAVEFQEKFGLVMAVGGSLVIGPIAYLLVALVFWAALKIQGSEIDYRTSFSVILHALVPSVIVLSVLSLPAILSGSSFSSEELREGVLPSNLAVLAGEEASAVTRALLSSVDLFSIWSLALLALGFTIAARISRSSAWVTTIALWLVYVGGKIGLTAAFS